MSQFHLDQNFAKEMDADDPLAPYRTEFLIPKSKDGEELNYFVGNSLGLQPKATSNFVRQELEEWGRLGIFGHLEKERPWYSYHELVTPSLSRLVGARPGEVVAMNSTTVNLHLLLISFYRPTKTRFKILVEEGAFPSDQYAVASQARWHGLDLKNVLLTLRPRPGEECLRTEDIVSMINREGHSISVILLGHPNFRTGQAFEIAHIIKAAHEEGIQFGLDIAHGIGNLPIALHDWGVDFAVWCHYKYLNSGPGAIGGAFVHEKHRDLKCPRLEGWWGHHKEKRFQMASTFEPIGGAESWQLSNPPILQLAALRASLALFDRIPFNDLRKKSEKLTGYLEFLIRTHLGNRVQMITPQNPSHRGSQLSFRVKSDAKQSVYKLASRNFVCDFRMPDVIRVAPVPFYNRFSEVHELGNALVNCV